MSQVPNGATNSQPLPPVAPPPQVILVVVNNQVQLQSNVVSGPQGWRVIAQICLQGATAALAELAKLQAQEDGSRIVVPSLQVKGPLTH